MADATLQAVGLSVGATTVAAVTADTAVVRTPVLTYHAQRPPMVGTPWENSLPHADERGQVIGDFVDRVGDPVGILASDGSAHRGERLLAEALRALAHLARGERDLAAVSYPAHWRPQAVDALRREVSRVPEWSRTHVPVISDVAAAVTALQRDPGLPLHGVVAVCDFGGSGTSLTLVDAANGYRPIGATVRHLDFSGDLIDQALLTHVIGGLAEAGAVDLASTSAIGSLSTLRLACRGAKERLSSATVTTVPVDLPGHRGEVRLTRAELDDVVRAPLRGVLDALEDTLSRNGVRPADLTAVATVGGGAAMVAVTTALSETLRVPVITSARPGLSAAMGAALHALRGPADDSATAMAAAPASMTATMAAAAVPQAGLAWSQADDIPDVVPVDAGGWTGARPQIEFVEDPAAAHTDEPPAWYRRPALAVAAAAAVLLAAVGGVGVALTSETTTTPASTPIPAPAPASPPAPAPEPLAAQPPSPAAQQVPAAIRTVTAIPAPVTRTQVMRAPAPANPPAPAPSATTPPPPTTTTPPPTTTSPPPTTTSPPTTTTPPTSTPPPTTTPPPPVTETVTETVPPSPEPDPPAAEPDPPASDPAPDPAWTMPPLPTIPGLPTLLPQP